MVTPGSSAVIRTGLLDRRGRLAATIELVPNNTNLQQLLVEVDAALDRLTAGRYGVCEVCNERIGEHHLLVDPLRRYCFSHLAPEEQVKILRDQAFALPDAALGVTGGWEIPAPTAPAARRWRLIEALKAAWKILRTGTDDQRQREDNRRASDLLSELLPTRHLRLEAWEVYYDYACAGPVGGDFCDLVPVNTGELFLFLGDAMGKGIAASMIASRLHAVFRTLLDLKLPIDEMLDRANRIFCECVRSTGYYATLVCGRAFSTGTLELINAGHPPPLLLRSGGAERVVATGMPLGLFYASKYEVTRIQLAPGETILLYTDGVTESRNRLASEYGTERLAHVATEQRHLAPEDLVRTCLDDVAAFASGAPSSDDLTVLALQRQ